jgi:hypothetical protein
VGNQLKREPFVGKYDGTCPPTLLPPGSVSGGLNMRKLDSGGWKARKGCALHNTTALESGAAVKSLHFYRNPLQNDVSFIAQCNSKLIKGTNVPPAGGTTFGTALSDVAGSSALAGTTKGFSDQVGEWWFYADGSGRPVVYGGASPFPQGFLNYDSVEKDYIDHTRRVKDNREDTTAILVLTVVADVLYVIGEEPLTGVTLAFGSTVNSEAGTTMTVAALRNGTFTNVSDTSDGTIDGGISFAKDGSITWTASSSDTPGVMGGYFGYVYRLTPSAAFTTGITVKSLKVIQLAARMTNKWHRVFEWPSGCRFWDNSAGEFIEALGKVTTESTSLYIDMTEATVDDFIYIKTPEPACAFVLAPVPGYENSADAQIDLIECLEGNAWTDISTFVDTTLDSAADSSFANFGVLTFNTSALYPTLRTNKGDNAPGYWYRISWDATMSTDLRLYLVAYATAPETLPAYDGCIEFKGRLMLWGDPEFPNRMRASQFAKPFSFTGTDSGYTDELGHADKILVAKKFYSELIIWKRSSMWLLEGYNMATFGSARITAQLGIASPKSAQVIETGYMAIHADEPKMIAIWQAIDGVYVFDGRKPRKVSQAVDQYFNMEYSTCIAAADIYSLDSYVDYTNSEYHLLLPTAIGGVTELVYKYLLDQWNVPWTRSLALTCGLLMRGWYSTGSVEERYYTYGGTSGGFVLRLETDTSDKNASNEDVAISQALKTRAIGAHQEQGIVMKFTLRRVSLELQARSAGTLTTTFYADRATSGVTVATPAALSMVESGSNLACPTLQLSKTQLLCFELEFTLASIDQELELYAMLYEMDIQGLINL